MEIDLMNFVTVSSSLLFFLLALKFLMNKTRPRVLLPPSPFGLPVFGHLHLLSFPMHRTFHELSCKHGGIFSLRLGSRLLVVVSTTSAVEECFTKNDVVLANRPEFISGKFLPYASSTLAAAPYGDHWRNLRRLSAVEIFSNSRLNAFSSMRKDEVRIFLQHLYGDSSRGFSKVQMRSRISELVFNMIMRMVVGKRYYGEEVNASEEAREFRELLTELLSIGVYAGDFLPFLKWVNGHRYIKQMEKLGEKVDGFLQGLVDESRSLISEDGASDTMITHLLRLQQDQPESYSDEIIKGFIITILSAGTKTSSATIEWALSNLLNHPETLIRVRAELDNHLGEDRMLEEADLTKLQYLQNVIAETLRLYPPAPLLAPHVSSKSCTIGGFHIPAYTMIMVNAWSIHKDPNLWENPTSFIPERFESGRESEGYRMLPFGMGRRACPGIGMANRVVGLTLGSLIHGFEWKRMSEDMVEMKEGKGNGLLKDQPLECLCKPRSFMHKVVPQMNFISN